MINLMDLSEMQQRNESGKYQKIAVEGMSVESQILGLDKICLKVISQFEVFYCTLLQLKNEIREIFTEQEMQMVTNSFPSSISSSLI